MQAAKYYLVACSEDVREGSILDHKSVVRYVKS